MNVVVGEGVGRSRRRREGQGVEFAGDRCRRPGQRVDAAGSPAQARSRQRPPAPPRVIVSVSVAPTLGSPIVTPANGSTARLRRRRLAGDRPRDRRRDRRVTVDHAGRRCRRQARAGVLTSHRLKVVVEDVFGAPALGVKMRASSSLVIAAAVPDNV